ncbi:protein root UVB sensitive 6-like isoform X3 [Magnolia sinica]|uniref:protein root UVB sensitive 6-like isoform X3 n=1 Tax=Magnolia sinica TaxID=86752 RepID=UPI002659E75B|nr:protein root UVB sensitive 6-like isoform X3 [Magnolia sinica]
MAPIQFKQSPTPAQTLESSQDARILVRETLRISADLASSSPYSPSLIAAASCGERPGVKFGLVEADFLDSSLSVLCCEEIDGRRWKYVAARDGSGGFRKSSIRAIELHSPEAPFNHFFGGAMGVFTTQTLLSSVGMSIDSSTSGAVAINWILKDGAGRVGKMLFARQGKKFDNDLKQLRFASDLVMELGAGVELATAAMPHLFLPLACAANVAKNVAAVTSTSTHTPIYKAFAKGENIGDVTAKGECVANIADLLGTGLSIMISKRNPSLVATFALLSCGYVLSSYQEVKSVVLHTLNRGRFTMAVEAFLKTGHVPSLKEANSRENIFSFPWAKDRPIVLGPRFGDAFQEPAMFLAIEPLFEKEKYIVTYNPTKGNVYALFKDLSKSDDILKAAFHHYRHMCFCISSVHQTRILLGDSMVQLTNWTLVDPCQPILFLQLPILSLRSPRLARLFRFHMSFSRGKLQNRDGRCQNHCSTLGELGYLKHRFENLRRV